MSSDRNIYDDDFLDSLMEEVQDVSRDSVRSDDDLIIDEIEISSASTSQPSEPEQGNLSQPGGLVGRMTESTSQPVVNDDRSSGNGGSSHPQRRGGLLSQLGGNDSSGEEDSSSGVTTEIDVSESDSGGWLSGQEENLESNDEVEDGNPEGDSPLVGVGGGSLLGRLGGEVPINTDSESMTEVSSASSETEVSSDPEDSASSSELVRSVITVSDDSGEPARGTQPAQSSLAELTSIERTESAEVSVNEVLTDNSGGVDSLDSMLDDLAGDDENVEEMVRRAELDPDVEVPLEKPGMDEVIVTPDGRSLADMLPGMRGGNRRTTEVVADIRDQKKVIDVQGSKFSDNRYTKHIENTDKERAVDEERIALSMKFLQRHAKFSEQEKVIMRNLGLNNEQLAKVMSSQELNMKEKEEILALGRYGSEKHFKGRRYRTTVGDTAMLEFLTKFKFANTRILRWISNEPQGRTWRKLNRLRNSGLAESKSLIGVPDLWAATPSGIAISGYAYEPGLRPMPKMMSISSNMGVNYLAACLWFNSVNVLNLEDFPAHNRVVALQDDGRDRVQGEMLVSEYELRSSLGKEINPQSTTMKTLGDQRLYDIISANVRNEIEAWEDGGKLGESPEFSLGNEYMWVLYPTSQLTLSYHVPDLVVKRERGPNGEPRSIAVEMERFEKSNDRYDKIMLAYKLDEHLYESVIWVTPSTRVARALERAADSVGFDRYSIIPIITESGVYSKQDIWMI